MPEDRNNNRKKKKKKNKVSATDQKLKEKPERLSSIPQLPPQDSGQVQLPDLRAAETSTASDSKEPAHVMELSVQARESLRWEGELQDPQEEAKRLERYRASRRQRYITHREALLKETQQNGRLQQTNKKQKMLVL
ncbi:PREDICTED: protein LIAT1 isoform X2 [Cyprinodon variegatus]|uniref:protein LIAT1 isoform X2 n=1 Tax=Cyprinodon variegatus TaxID=28743 RepID=UPI00074277CD|nr:PREDICTED: protein LIAT1 isoform X2 [Cyprinodon variegatus]